jgi:DNA-binding NtrC family response regulator
MPTMHGSAERGTGAVAGARILAVEDDYVVLLEIATVLEAAAAVVLKCTTVEDALQAIDANRFDAAVLDMRIGQGTVAPVAHKLAELGTPFVFYTGLATSEETIRQWPRTRIVPKPAAAGALVRAVADLLNSAKPGARDG